MILSLPILLVLLLWGMATVPSLAEDVTLTPDADTFTRSGVSAGAAEVLDIRHQGESDIVGYIRFDLSSIEGGSVKDATLTLHKVGAVRNDTLIEPRHVVYGLSGDDGNTPQDWPERDAAEGRWGAERKAVGVDVERVVNLDADAGVLTDEHLDGDTITLTGDDLVSFLNHRLADNGLATFILGIQAENRGYGFASREHPDPELRPTLTVTPGTPEPPRPTLYIIGDSTVRVVTPGQRGWGSEIDAFFDTDRINVENRAIGGRSSRTFRTERRWAEILTQAKPGDYVLMQFGHNDSGPLDDTHRARGTIRGIGNEAQGIYNPIKEEYEVVRTYGWYMRQYVQEAKAHGMTPIVLSYIPRAPATDRPVPHYEGPQSYALYAKQVAEQEDAPFIDLYGRIWNAYEMMDSKQIRQELFGEADHTHTSLAGARFNAERVVEGIRDLESVDLKQYLKRPNADANSDVDADQRAD